MDGFSRSCKEVQEIGATISDSRSSPHELSGMPMELKIIDQERNVRKYTTINECVINEKSFVGHR